MAGLRGQPDKPPVDTFDGIYAEYRAKVYRVILRMVRNPSDAEDLTQETFLKVQKSLLHLRRSASISSWLYRVATNTALDFLRHSSRPQQQTLPLQQDIEASSQSPSPERALDLTISAGCVHGNTDRLPEQYRIVLLLHDIEGLPIGEVAEVMGSSVGATKVRLHRARKRFKEICSEDCEQYYDDEGVLLCRPRAPVTLAIDNGQSDGVDPTG